MTAPRAAWREPMVWLLLAIPAATVAGGIATMRLARAGAMDAVPDRVQRTAQAQVADLGADARAADLQLRATLRIDARGHVAIDVADAAGAAALALRLVHPTRADGDLAWTRAAGASALQGPALPADARGHWVLEDATREWRLVGERIPGERSARLQPAVAAP